MKGVFITVFIILMIFNVLYLQVSPESSFDMYVGALTGLLATTISVGVLGGVQLLGTGLNSESIKILFGTSSLINILFSINIGSFPVGLGLASNVINVFSENDISGIGFVLSTILACVGLISGLIIVVGGGD